MTAYCYFGCWWKETQQTHFVFIHSYIMYFFLDLKRMHTYVFSKRLYKSPRLCLPNTVEEELLSQLRNSHLRKCLPLASRHVPSYLIRVVRVVKHDTEKGDQGWQICALSTPVASTTILIARYQGFSYFYWMSTDESYQLNYTVSI